MIGPVGVCTRFDCLATEAASTCTTMAISTVDSGETIFGREAAERAGSIDAITIADGSQTIGGTIAEIDVRTTSEMAEVVIAN